MILDAVPIPLVFVAIIAVAYLASEVGFKVANRIRNEDGLDKYPIENSASGIVLGLLAFILAFSFGGVADRYKNSIQLSLNDNDAIQDVYVMADFLPDETAKQVRSLLYEYHRVRLEGIRSQDMTRMQAAIKQSEEIHDQLWPIVVNARKADNNSILNQFISMVHVMMDTHNERVHKALDTRLPPAIWWTTGGLLILSAMLLGLSSGLHGKRSRLASAVVVVCFSSVLIMIVDLDRPFRTLFEKSEDPTATQLLERMEADAAN
jgi:hypothetical protein